MKTKDTSNRKGFKNRHIEGLPKENCIIKIIYNDFQGDCEMLCEWKPFNKSDYTKEDMPSNGYLGTARKIVKPFKGIGFHAWEQNNSEFVYYSIME